MARDCLRCRLEGRVRRVALQGSGYRVTIAMMPETVAGRASVERAVISTSYAEHLGLQTNQAGMLLLVNRNYRGLDH